MFEGAAHGEASLDGAPTFVIGDTGVPMATDYDTLKSLIGKGRQSS